MAAKSLANFGEIIEAVREALGVESSDTRNMNNIRRFINMTYLHRIVPAKRWRWLEGETTLVHKAKYTVGTASVTEDSTTVTLSVAPTSSVGDSGSFLNYKFSVEGFDEVYTISAHTALSTSITLSGVYLGDTAATANYKIWRDVEDLPTDCEETVEVYINQIDRPLKPIGLQEMRKKYAGGEKLEGYATYYTTRDYYDPSTGDAETESDRYRRLQIWPSCLDKNYTIKIDYKKEVTALDADADEPLMPASDRISLYYGACAEGFAIINRDPENSSYYQNLFISTLGRLAGDETEDSFDKPSITPDGDYINTIRRSGLGRRKRYAGTAVGGGGSPLPSYLANVTINGGNLTGNLTADSGITVDGVDISDLASLSTPTSITLNDNQSLATAATTWLVSSYDIIHLHYSIYRGSSNIEAGNITIITDGTNASLAQGNVATLGTVGVTFTCDYSGGSLRLLYTSTSTGTAPILKLSEFKWLSSS